MKFALSDRPVAPAGCGRNLALAAIPRKPREFRGLTIS